MINYKLVRSSRKTICINIRNGAVEVRAPYKSTQKEIEQVLLSKQKWINQCLANQRAIIETRASFELDYGSLILWRGNLYPIVQGEHVCFTGDAFHMPPGLSPQQIKAVCILLYRQLGLAYFTERTKYYSKKMGVTPSAVKVNGAKTRWGSCSSKKSINFSWRLGLACDEIIDYVVVHELAHLLEMNHSARFWAIVKDVLPGYAAAKTGLKALQIRLANENWE